MTARPVLDREATPRDRHYGTFYGLDHLGDRPLLVVHGNCQAEALRVVLSGTGGGVLVGVRVPPVHELVPDDVPHLRHLLGRAAVVVAQPVRDGYHGLPVGTREVLAASPRAQHVIFPVVRHQLLHPFQALVRVEGVGDPPVVAYHDLRTLLRAAGRPPLRPGPGALREVGERAVEELRSRQSRHGTLAVDDLLLEAGAQAAHTINHPGNRVLVGLARRVQHALGLDPDAVDPGRILLGGVRAPLEPAVLAAHRLPGDSARPHWVVDGAEVDDEVVAEQQLAWYRDRPDVVREGLRRCAATLEVLAS